MSAVLQRVPEPIELVIEKLVRDFHPELGVVGLRIDAYFAFADQPDSGVMLPVLNHQGYPVAARIKSTSAMLRARNHGDVSLEIDAAVFAGLKHQQRLALLDHELEHVELMLDLKHRVKWDVYDRPRVKMRKHDAQFGWFARTAARWGESSLEVLQARQLYLGPLGGLFWPTLLHSSIPPGRDHAQRVSPQVAAERQWSDTDLEDLVEQVEAHRAKVKDRRSKGDDSATVVKVRESLLRATDEAKR